MTLDEFRLSLTATEPPAELPHALVGLWWDARGDWARAHESAQQDEGVEGSLVHAYLHRKEGDESNAAYWYNRAGKSVCREPLDAEWVSIARALLRGDRNFPNCESSRRDYTGASLPFRFVIFLPSVVKRPIRTLSRTSTAVLLMGLSSIAPDS